MREVLARAVYAAQEWWWRRVSDRRMFQILDQVRDTLPEPDPFPESHAYYWRRLVERLEREGLDVPPWMSWAGTAV